MDGNGQKNSSIGDTNGAIIRLDFGQSIPLNFQQWTVTNNYVGQGPIIDINYIKEPNEQPYQRTPGLTITKGLYANNTSTSKAALFVFDLDLPWLHLAFSGTNLTNNFGTIANDVYARNIRRLDFLQSWWGQQPEKHELPMNPRRNTAKFIAFDKYDYELNVENSRFDCRMPFDRATVFAPDKDKPDRGEVPVFKFVMPFNKTFFVDRDLAAESQKNDPSSQYYAAMTCLANTDPAFNATTDPQKKYVCERGKWQWRFTGTSFQNCNQGAKGGIFHLTNGAKVSITGQPSRAVNNSATRGGFAYLRDPKTELIVEPTGRSARRPGRATASGRSVLEGQNAYYGGAFYLEDKARVTLREVKIWKSEVYEGSIYLVARAWAQMERLLFVKNIVHDRALISTHHWSFFSLKRSRFLDNEGVWDSVLIEIDGPRWHRHF